MVALSSATLKATGHSTKQSFADHFRRYVNVKGFGALGNGTNDDTFAIQSAANWTSSVNRGTLYFPPGAYKITQPITLAVNGTLLNMEGDPGATITGSVNDFLIKYQYSDAAFSGVSRGIIERLTIINTHVTGGGIRYGTCVGGEIRDCIITANKGVYTSIDDITWIPFEVSIYNCHFDPGSNPSGATGLLQGADGAIVNCTFTGFGTAGARAFGGQGCMNFLGCSFELCDSGYKSGNPSGTGTPTTQNAVFYGNKFINNGTGIDLPKACGFGVFGGNYISAVEGTISGNPQYGMNILQNSLLGSSIYGLTVTGQYQQAGIRFQGGEAALRFSLVAGVGVTNTGTLGSTTTWTMPVGGATGKFLANNVKHVITTVPSGAGNVLEGDDYNVSNSNTAVWGATYASGGSNHVKVRRSDANWTVVGK